ncbi:hypothetical protein Csa_023939, partial [Cucumis sativus]
ERERKTSEADRDGAVTGGNSGSEKKKYLRRPQLKHRSHCYAIFI